MNYREIQDKLQTISLPDWTEEQWAQFKVDLYNKTPGELKGFDCKKCLNRGHSLRVGENLIPVYVPCECINIRKSLSALERSGLSAVIESFGFDNFKAHSPWQKKLKQMAEKFVSSQNGEWFFVSGTPGSGKTHICTAICKEFLDTGHSVRYFVWPHEIRRLKSLVNESEYQSVFDEFYRADLLYIDDLFKVRALTDLTNSDITRTFELINARYPDKKKRTVFSSEYPIADILRADNATGSRIYQRAGEFLFDLSRDTRRNYRLYGGKEKNECE